MAYHIALLAHLEFGFEVVNVECPEPNHGIFVYPILFPTVTLEHVMEAAADEDILIVNPSYSQHWFGLRCRGRKVMYIQGFSTFQLLDCRFDLYVSASTFVQRFIVGTYGIHTCVIPPFIRIDRFPSMLPWGGRRAGSILVSQKGDENLQRLLLDRLRRELESRAVGIGLGDMRLSGVPQAELFDQIGTYRYFLTLSPAEGFGLIPLEAMAMGVTVLGFDGFGGRDYMRSGVNCDVTAFADIEGVADRIVRAVTDLDYALALARAGQETAQRQCFTYDHFRAGWLAQFNRLLARQGT
jgi:glycosyltransferase involved in cell wall biosynthesis